MFRFFLSVKPFVLISLVVAFAVSLCMSAYCLRWTFPEEHLTVAQTVQLDEATQPQETGNFETEPHEVGNQKDIVSYSIILQTHHKKIFRAIFADGYANINISSIAKMPEGVPDIDEHQLHF